MIVMAHDVFPRSARAEGDFAHLCRLARPHYTHDDPAHDWPHIERVLAWSERIGRAEGARLGVLRAAVVLHDLVNLPKDHPQRLQASQMCADAAEPLLRQAGYDPALIPAIQAAIVEHSYSLGRSPSSLEAAILQDADRLDALGAVGLMRAVSTGARMARRFYDPADPFARARPLDQRRQTVDHVYTKLLRLPEQMNTATARAEAHARAAFLRAFLDQLAGEVAPAHPDPEAPDRPTKN
ncbi:hypothetical protein CCR80_12035 [Rhodothalassium salexigens]|nr:hypothetical protein [Rhodothalassium salexigens]